MKFLKENSYDIVKLYVNQIGIMIFSMFLIQAVGFVEDEKLSGALTLAVSVFSILFFYVLLYYVMWEIGAKDKIRIDGGRMEPCKFKGLFSGCFANVPNLVISVLTLVFLCVYVSTESQGIYDVFVILNLILRFHCSMYLGLITCITPVAVVDDVINFDVYILQTVLFVIIPLLSALVTHFAYTMGSKDKKLLGFIGNNASKK